MRTPQHGITEFTQRNNPDKNNTALSRNGQTVACNYFLPKFILSIKVHCLQNIVAVLISHFRELLEQNDDLDEVNSRLYSGLNRPKDPLMRLMELSWMYFS